MAPTLKMIVLSLASVLGGCAASPEPGSYSLASDGQQPPAGTAPASAPAAASPAYVLSEEEKSVDCKRLTGRMKIRIIQIRDYNARANTSALSRNMQLAHSQVWGTTVGINPDAEYTRDRAMLDAYNAQLATKGCKTLDLAAELKS